MAPLAILDHSCFWADAPTVPGGRHPDGQYLTVPSFHSSLYKSVKYFGHSCAIDAPKIWNDLPDNVQHLLPPSGKSSILTKLTYLAPCT